jgi:hypothetical protein
MRKTTKQIALMALLTGIAGVLAVTALPGRGLRAAAESHTLHVTAVELPATTQPQPVVLLTESQPPPPRVSVSFTDDTSESYALGRGVPPDRQSTRRTDLDLWYGEYSDRDYRPLPASPLENEPSRLNVKLSIRF